MAHNLANLCSQFHGPSLADSRGEIDDSVPLDHFRRFAVFQEPAILPPGSGYGGGLAVREEAWASRPRSRVHSCPGPIFVPEWVRQR
jgi:hypothetical protein